MIFTLSNRSRYKDTAVFEQNGKPVFGLFESPREFNPPVLQTFVHRVKQHEVGFLDLLARLYYGDESLWWVIALVNGLTDVEREMYAGQALSIPTRELVLSFESRNG